MREGRPSQIKNYAFQNQTETTAQEQLCLLQLLQAPWGRPRAGPTVKTALDLEPEICIDMQLLG